MDLSIVIPVKDEEENLPALMAEIRAALAPTGLRYEVLVIDDGSRDGTWKVLQELVAEFPFIRGQRFQYNCGKAAALSLGFSLAQGRYVVTMDGDLQDNPLEVPKMLALLDQGVDLVSGWKKRRYDPWHKTWPSKLFNFTVSAVCGQRLHDFNCGLKAYRREVVGHIPLYGDFHRFIPVMAHWRGFRITEMAVEHRARVHGVSKYGVSRLISGFLDLVTLVFLHRFAVKPLHFFGSVGLGMSLLGSGVMGAFGIEWICTGALHVRPLLVLAGFALVMGIQFISLGLLGEMLNNRLRQNEYPVSDHLN
jgi:glycosyltransferase involved in cell wall biosynthesis